MAQDQAEMTETIQDNKQLQDNLSSYQIATVLDTLLFEALRPLAHHTRVIQHWLAEMLPLAVSDGRRKLSRTQTRDQFVTSCYIAINTTDPDQLMETVDKLKIERNQIFHLVIKVQEICNTYLDDMMIVAQTKSHTKRTFHRNRMQKVEDLLQTDRNHWHQALLTMNWWIDLAFNFKQMVAEKYYRLAYKKALEAEHGTRLSISLADLYNNYILAIYRAIDKYDSDNGMLASYVQMWFKNASSNPDYDHEINIAFTIPASQRRLLQRQNWTNRKGQAIMNIANPIDEQILETEAGTIQTNELAEQLSDLGQKLDLDLFMLLNNIPYRLTEEECKAYMELAAPTPKIKLQIKD